MKESVLAMLAAPRSSSSNLPISGPALPGGYAQDFTDFGTVPLGGSSAAASIALPLPAGQTTMRILGIATVGDYLATDSCGGAVDASTPCTVSVVFHPVHAGLATGELVALCGRIDSSLNLTVAYIDRFTLLGFGAGSTNYVATVVTTAQVSDPAPAPGVTASDHCFAAAADPVAATLTGVFVSIAVSGGSTTITLHHSATAGASFDVFCTSGLAPAASGGTGGSGGNRKPD